MDIALLSVSMNVYSTQRIAEEAKIAGHYVEQIDHTKCAVLLGSGKPKIYWRGEDISNAFDAVIPRIGTKVTRHGVAVVKQFEMNGIFTTAKASSIEQARNKTKALQILARKGLPLPKTIFSIDADTLEAQLAMIGGAPIIIKLQEGTQGMGVVLADSTASAVSMIDTFNKMDTPILLQEYIEESRGEDIRCFIVGQKIVASMKRTNSNGEFRANVHRGGKAQAVALTPKEAHIALSASKHLNLGVAGVDLIRSKNGPLLLEVNASPGLRGIEAATGVNIAREIINFTAQHVRYKRK